MDRLYYTDSYLTRFSARVLDRSDGNRRLVLDRTAFYPPSGGQPPDQGWIDGARVEKIEEENGSIVHTLSAPVESDEVEGTIDWDRRFDHMQQHSGQHLLSAAIAGLFGCETVSVHMGAETSTIDLRTDAFSSAQLEAAEERANALVTENRAVLVTFEDASAAEGLRKASARSGALRIVTIAGLDRSACGGTHVKFTGEIGTILLRGVEKIRGDVRIQFLCGGRAVRQARSDYRSLSRIAQAFAARADNAPELVESALARLQESDKLNRKLQGELYRLRGEQLYAKTDPGPGGRRIHRNEVSGAIPEEVRLEAQGFTSKPDAVYIAVAKPLGALLLASSCAGLNAGAILKAAVAPMGGRGGGSAQMAQGSVPEDRIDAAIRDLENAFLAG